MEVPAAISTGASMTWTRTTCQSSRKIMSSHVEGAAVNHVDQHKKGIILICHSHQTIMPYHTHTHTYPTPPIVRLETIFHRLPTYEKKNQTLLVSPLPPLPVEGEICRGLPADVARPRYTSHRASNRVHTHSTAPLASCDTGLHTHSNYDKNLAVQYTM